jgi:DNA polymerase III, alpha subunit
MRFPNNEFYLKSQEEMRKLFADLPEAIENSNRIARRCQVSFDLEKPICRSLNCLPVKGPETI